jgi:hypothetical protein
LLWTFFLGVENRRSELDCQLPIKRLHDAIHVCRLDLGAGEYHVFLKIEANRHYPLHSVQKVVCANVQTRRAKLLQVALNPDIAHGKVRDEAEFEENVAKKRAERRNLGKFKTRGGKKLTKDKKPKKHLENN